MALTPGTRLGPYEIVAPLGVGGMGEVYRARDTRLGRDVAVKIMPEHLSGSTEIRARFEREARAVSSLNHPNICTLHDIGRHEGIDFLVMECLEGETLAARLARGPLAAADALRYAIQIADALDRAHRQGIVHRDLKPGNVMITRSGAKLLDFGLARSAGLLQDPAGVTLSPTRSQPLTAEGAIVGTFQYMAPEQLEGREADARTDIFAFGAVLYEMLTGRRAFEGRSQASVIGAIMAANPPDIQQFAPATPPALQRVVRTCLSREPDDRWQTAHDLMMQLRWLLEPASDASAGVPAAAADRPRTGRGREWLFIATTLVLAVVCAGLGAALATRSRASAAAAPMQLAILPPEDAFYRPWNSMAISPDGRRLVFYAVNADGVDGLWMRSLDGTTAGLMKGTEGGNASFPFWSPDSGAIGYFIDGKLRTLSVDGGVPVEVCDAPDGRGGTWSADGTIVFSPEPATGLMRVPATGGTPVPVTTLQGEKAGGGHMWPFFLSDGRHFLFIEVDPQNRGVAALNVGSIDTTEVIRVTTTGSSAVYTRSGHLLFLRDGSLVAQPMHPSRFTLSGNPVVLAAVSRNLDTGYGAFTVSETGMLIYRTGADSGRQLMWFDRAGRRLDLLGEGGDVSDPALSPDGSHLAFSRVEPNALRPDIWVLDVARGAGMRLTFGPDDDTAGRWSPDGRFLYFSSFRDGRIGLYRKQADGAGEDAPVAGVAPANPQDHHHLEDVSRDGAWLIYGTHTTSDDLWMAPLQGAGSPAPLLDSRFNEHSASVSPDGRWIAYVSDESGRSEVYVRDFPRPVGKWQISTRGGVQPRWRRDGRELFYLAPDRQLTAVSVDTAGSSLRVGIPQALFRTGLAVYTPDSRYDVSADGQRFVVVMPSEGSQVVPTMALLNWTALLRTAAGR